MMNNASLFGPSTSVNQNRISSDYLFGDTTAMPALLGLTAALQPSFSESTMLHRTESLTGLDKLNKKNVQITSNKFHSEESKDHQRILFSTTMKSTTSTSFLFDQQPPPSVPTTFTFGDSQSSSLATSSSPFPTIPFASSLSKAAITPTTTTAPTLFSTMNQAKASVSGSQLFQTMVKTPTIKNGLAFLTRNTKSSVTIDRPRPSTQLYSTALSKPTKRKYDESVLDDDADALFPTNQPSKINIKRPRMLDMNKIRSIVLGNNETYLVKSSIDKRFATYEDYVASKKSDQRSFRLPRLTHRDYDTEPAIEALQSCFNEQGQCFVKEFTITRKHYGSVTFQGEHMNLAGLDLDRLVEIDRRQVTIYPDEKDRPNEGEELNCQAIISLFGVYPIDRSKSNGGEEVTDPKRLIEMNYGTYLEGMTSKFQGHFLDYDVHTGTWTFRVEHF